MNFIKKHFKKITIIILIIIGIIIVKNIFSGSNEEEVDVEYANVTRGDVSKYIEKQGVIKSDNGEIKASVTGKIVRDNVKEGNTVKKGDLLYKIDSSNVQEDINELNQEIRLLQDEYNEIKKEVGETNVILDNNGIIESIDVNVGDEIKKGDPIAKLLNTDKLILNVELNEENINLLKDLYVRKVIKIIVKGQEVDGLITSVNEFGFDVSFNRVSDEVEGEKAKTSITGDEEYIIKYYDEVSIVSNVNGTITNINYKNNDKVVNGNILLSTNKGESSELSSKGLELNKKRKELNKLRNSLEDYNVYATQDGVVSKKTAKANDMYDGNSVMCVISGSNEYYSIITVSEEFLKYIKEGQKVEIKSKLFDEIIDGEVSNISYQPNEEENQYGENNISYYPVKININNTNNEEIFNGMHISLKILLDEKKDVLIVPTDAILQGGYVYRVNENGEREKVNVELGISDNENVEIKKGLNENDTVVLYGTVIDEANYEEEETYEEE